MGLVLALRGCFGYSEVSPKTYEFAKALLQITQRREDPKLPKTRAESVSELEQQIEAAQGSEELTESETKILTDIIALTREDDWDSAKAELRDLLAAQVKSN